ncbi:hypothetical protein AUR64_02860 [Haloprofundus marisrubri]|uniref:HVO-0234-like beta-propeller domain-containing protein n=1 Tax=Haloprofundus marisrubri TaxID=1514971 RepID=A0A0W1R366_9EURY|nr:hypothetical protein AUR64_02860 [Haloprofundus marisrubri]
MAESPVEKTLTGVVQTSVGPFAVGTGGKVLRRRTDGSWTIVVPQGPATKRNKLTDVDVTDDGKRIWFAGSSGALGMYNTETGEKHDYSAPGGKTSTWEAIAVGGGGDGSDGGSDGSEGGSGGGGEHLLIANGSGEVLSATIDDDGCPSFGEVVKPGSGSTIPALALGGDAAYAIDTSGNVFERTDGEWADIGIRNAQVNFHDIYASERTLLVSGGGGLVYRYDRPCTNWTPIAVGKSALFAIDFEGDRAVAVGGGGVIHQRRRDDGWTQLSSPVESKLRSVALGDVDVAVGNSGTIVERAGGDR